MAKGKCDQCWNHIPPNNKIHPLIQQEHHGSSTFKRKTRFWLTYVHVFTCICVCTTCKSLFLFTPGMPVEYLSLQERACPLFFFLPWIYLLNYRWKNIKIYKAITTDILNFMGMCILIDSHKSSAVKVILQLYLEITFITTLNSSRIYL